MHLMVLGASRPAGCGRCRGRNLFVSMHLMVLGASRHNGTLPLPDEQLVSMHLMVLGASRPSACCPLSRLGKRAPDRHWPKSALGPGCTSPIKADFAQFSQGSPPTDLLGLRATRMSTRPCGSGAVPCSSDTSAQARATNREALARRPPGGRRRASSQDWAPQVLPVGEATTVPPQGSWWPGTVGVVRC